MDADLDSLSGGNRRFHPISSNTMSSMRRFLKTVLKLCSAASLVLCIAVAGLWIGGKRFIVIGYLNHNPYGIAAGSLDGGLIARFCINDNLENHWKTDLDAIVYDRNAYTGPPRTRNEAIVYSRHRVPAGWLGFGYAPRHLIGDERLWDFRVPYAAGVLLFLILPLLRLWPVLRARRLRGFPVMDPTSDN